MPVSDRLYYTLHSLVSLISDILRNAAPTMYQVLEWHEFPKDLAIKCRDQLNICFYQTPDLSQGLLVSQLSQQQGFNSILFDGFLTNVD